MFNSFFIALSIFLVLISYNVILLNEEILILICFILFIWVALNKFSKFIRSYFIEYAMKIEKSIRTPLLQTFCLLKKIIALNLKFKNLIITSKNLKIRFSTLFLLISKFLPNFRKNIQSLFYPKRFLFLEHLEKQVIKLLILFIIKKLNKIILLRQFYSKFSMIHFPCLYKITLRESLIKINQYK